LGLDVGGVLAGGLLGSLGLLLVGLRRSVPLLLLHRGLLLMRGGLADACHRHACGDAADDGWNEWNNEGH
jgi:hypothetical protein